MSDPVPGPSYGGAERRREPRALALRPGRLFLAGGPGPEVLILDISSSGALVRLRSSEALPVDLVLVDKRTALAHRAVIARRKDLELGLRFLRSLSVAGRVPPALQAAKDWCRPESPSQA